MMFFGIFESRENVAREFGIGISDLDGVNFICAKYTYENYSGEALVLFEKDGKIFKVEGGHCSCHGLESQGYSGQPTQWQPEEISLEYLQNWAKNCPSDFSEMLPLVNSFLLGRNIVENQC